MRVECKPCALFAAIAIPCPVPQMRIPRAVWELEVGVEGEQEVVVLEDPDIKVVSVRATCSLTLRLQASAEPDAAKVLLTTSSSQTFTSQPLPPKK